MKIENIRIVAFDCDGVMFESRHANQAFYNRILEHLGLEPLKPNQMDKVQMLTVDQALDYLVKDPEARREGRRFRLKMDYLDFVPMLEIEPDLKLLLAALRPRYKTAVATNRTNTMGAVLERFGLEGSFDLVVTAWDVENPKPHPESLEKILDAFSCRPDQMIYIGDSSVDQQAAELAGVLFAAYANKNLRADVYLESLGQLAQILGVDMHSNSGIIKHR